MREAIIPAEPCLVLLSLDMVWQDTVRRLYEFRKLESFHAGDTFENVRYRYEEHTCPVNVRADAMAFFIERKPLEYGDDPHGIWTVEGWITVKEALELGIKPADGTEAFGYDVIQTVLQRFKAPPEDWQVELDMVPDAPGVMYMRFLKGLEDRIMTVTTVHERARALDVETLERLVSNSLNMLERAEILLKLAMDLHVDLQFGKLEGVVATLPAPKACPTKTTT